MPHHLIGFAVGALAIVLGLLGVRAQSRAAQARGANGEGEPQDEVGSLMFYRVVTLIGALTFASSGLVAILK